MGEFRGSWCDTGVTMYGHWCHHVSDTGVTMYGHWCHHKKTTGYSHCLKTPTQVNTCNGDSRHHKKTISSKKTNVSKKTRRPARENTLSSVDERKRRTYTKTPQRHENPSTALTARSVGGWGSIGLTPAPKP